MNLPRWIPGQKVTLDRLNRRVAASALNGSLKVDPRTGLALVKYTWGMLLRRVFPLPVWGLLSGDGPVYDFVEAIDQGGGTWGVGVLAGTAFEVNKVAGLKGTRQWLRPDHHGAYRFQSLRYGSFAEGHCDETIITVLNSGLGTGKSGVAVTVTRIPLTGSPSTVASGTTASDGTFNAGSLLGPDGFTATISYEGVDATFSLGPCGSATFCVCSAEATVTTQPEATVTGSAPLGDVPDYRAASATRDGNTFKYVEIRRCTAGHPGYGSVFPLDAVFTASMAGAKDYCKTVTLDCGDSASVDLTLFPYEACYFPIPTPATLGNCVDRGCSYGPGPTGRGLAPRTVQIRLTSTRNLFADDEGVWITLSYDATTGYYDSGCRTGKGNFLSSPSGQLNAVGSYDTDQYYYGSTRIRVPFRPDASLGNLPGSYTRYAADGCTPSTGECFDRNGDPFARNCGLSFTADGALCSDCKTGLPGDDSCSPVDLSGSYQTTDALGFFTTVNYEIREVACS